MNPNTIMIFLFGIIGALAPEIVRFYKVRTTGPQIKNLLFYIIISIIFAVLGGVVAVILPTITLWGAFYAGVSLPVIISSIFGKPKEGPTHRELLELTKAMKQDIRYRERIDFERVTEKKREEIEKLEEISRQPKFTLRNYLAALFW